MKERKLGKAGRWVITMNGVNDSAFGHDGDSVYDDDRIVTFHDSKHTDKDWPNGQPVSGYYVQTLLEDRDQLEEGGLNLHGGVEAWSATPGEMAKVFKLIDKELKK
tara:strand:- start:449 stop:766 length:318 start_codon:yes stop_codon:yes gene_type:complete